MNRPVPQNSLNLSQGLEQDDDRIDLVSYLDLLFDNRWLIAAVALSVTLIGVVYAVVVTPTYEADILVQVEDGASSPNNILGELSSVFDLKTAASAEIEIIRSRLVLTRAVDNQQIYITAEPKYFPVIGQWIARGSEHLSNPGFLGVGGYAWGGEHINVEKFNIPASLQNVRFSLTATGGGSYRLRLPESATELYGHVGETVSKMTDLGSIELRVTALAANPGTQFVLVRAPVLETVEKLQKALSIGEKGRQSGIIGVSLEGADPKQTAQTLNEIGNQYIRQNVDRKSEEAEKSLAFLDKQLPLMKANLDQAEAKYNQLRNLRGTIDLDEEAKTILQESILSKTRLVELKQRRDELLTRFQNTNPIVIAVDQQIRTINNELAEVDRRIKNMPSIEQDVLRLTRDVKVNTELYTSLLNSAQQLRLVKASKVGNVRLLDVAEIPLKPIKPKKSVVVAAVMLLGLFLGVVTAFVRKNLFGGIEDPHEIEHILGLTVSASIPHSDKQKSLYAQLRNKPSDLAVLAHHDPQDLAIESLRSFRTSLKFSMIGAKNNIVMITGPTPAVGKSFVSANFAAVLAATGKKILLIDADLRKGYLQRYFALPRENGLSDVIVGQATIEEVVHHDVMVGVDFISTGLIPPNPSELLTHANFTALLQKVSAEYHLVIIDTAPVLAVSDALVVAPLVGCIFNIVRGGVSTIGEVEESVKRFNQAGGIVNGIVFNDLKQRVGRYGYGSKYGRYRYTQYKY